MFDDPEFTTVIDSVWRLPPPSRVSIDDVAFALRGAPRWDYGFSAVFYTRSRHPDLGSYDQFLLCGSAQGPGMYSFFFGYPPARLFDTDFPVERLLPMTLFLHLHPNITELLGKPFTEEVMAHISAWSVNPDH